ncbi:nucleolar complex protein 4 homolog B [Rhopalosiphum padi]|uniref:nucleolar complex protein 4 homolog B n=1 Tax=Rhopalosiphum padi TaxID=40932 RepID=UPI00298E2166|nr:nucleolar complex protein 4 homolog B [Rhopalosiphum padi]XP_060840354.1 nucleolar complex protein 4 homolog B [Rhopalosiphum padi]XP_060840355.1 nucleolar complex protein 4 homolog B [Rhopalosiphum padi]
MGSVAEFKKLFEKFLQENKCPTGEIVKKKYYFPVDQLKTIYTSMLTTTNIQWSQFQQLLTNYVEYLDFCYYSWECFSSIVQHLNTDKTNVYMFTNLLGFIKIPTEKKEDDKFLFKNNKRPQFKYNFEQLKSWVTVVWDDMKPFMLSNIKIRREMLTLLIEKMLMHLNNPLVTADFLMDSLDTPGPIAILGLQGIFILVKDYNLECPNIYGKLYNFFTTDMFNYRYKTRLFYLADIFLRSTHLPELLVAAFVKRMARLSLIAPPTDIQIMAAFIGNLLIRHPPLKVLIQSDLIVGSDPYIFEEKDPLKSNALDSSLWELLSLKQHILPKVGKSVNFLFKKLPQVEWDMSELLDNSYESIIDEEYKTDFQKVSLTYEKPVSFSVPLSNHMDDLWTLDD